MSEAVSALKGESHVGFATVTEAGVTGMITLRADLAATATRIALAGQGLKLPGAREIVAGDKGRFTGWMSPDELLVICAYEDAPAVAAGLAKSLHLEHALVTNVSDARARFTISGAKADQVLTKLCPVDFATLKAGEMRRTRAAQVAAAIWRSGPEELSLVCFRSVAGYVMGILEVSSRQGGELF
ncbi:heterotetrameric sarcosine oxidase gamma subunit [Rhodobacter viridis]|uniref:Heterotetrameric sarcosine oxidase gamma subunit n=1 Tax=Rhodobacter viridis TaxID=1054202 RepID=A0A318U6E2_9RHOB|nr:sarcosine oxidase subunit gamma family protein [Rhodobacter viridis]PYF10030.1 heterotetrameric sarcosine oxidase gamma subunit [Rhodobacter viridis]